jgi:menaquinone-dependent protoporphyrinogen oxidase
MKTLVAGASRHGATAELAAAIGQRLRERGFDVEVASPAAVESVDPYDAVVLGSAVYVGNWTREARSFLERHRQELAGKPVWLFSSGPVGDPGSEAMPGSRVDRLVEKAGALGHHVFAGRVDLDELFGPERLVLRAVHAPDGDFRDWADVANWSDGIADTLSQRRVGCSRR